jgi:hypothetical protein
MVDLLRVCYQTLMLIPAGGTGYTTVQWCFCRPGAEMVPQPTVFGSQNYYAYVLEQFEPGEQRYNGQLFINTQDVYTGLDLPLVGSAAQWNGSV